MGEQDRLTLSSEKRKSRLGLSCGCRIVTLLVWQNIRRSRLAEFKTKLSADAQQTKSSSDESVSASDEAARLEITSS
jgi:hypothetical protein